MELESDDDIGPMPLPAGEELAPLKKKKQRGGCL